MAENTRALFEIKVVDKVSDEVIFSQEVVADSESDALFESKLKECLKEKKITRDDVSILIREFGPVPNKERAKTVRLIGRIGKNVLARET